MIKRAVIKYNAQEIGYVIHFETCNTLMVIQSHMSHTFPLKVPATP
jgi:hypothetical protein